MELPNARRCGAFIVLTLTLIATTRAQAGIGRTPGTAFVDADGEAAYTIPIALPPGTNGMTPALSLEYRHRSPGGLLGIGWNIGGLSQIARCPRTIAQDGVNAAVSAISLDRLCLDGQRLVVVNGLAYGTPGAEYRTEIESFARIRSVAGASWAPRYFVVETLDGRVLEYGATADSRIDASTAADPAYGARVWALNRIRDRSGNVIDFQYLEDIANGSFRIAEIRYNSNPGAGVAASHRVSFIYESRPSNEVDVAWVAGAAIRQVVRLDRIDVMHEGTVLRRYELDYEPALSSAGRSRLAALRECGRNAADCLAPTAFTWQDGVAGFGGAAALPVVMPAITATAGHQVLNTADLNGDGLGDVVWAGGNTMPARTIRYRLGRRDGSFGAEVDTGIPSPSGIGKPFDYNGDGRSDLLMISPTFRWQIVPGTAAGVGAPIATGIAAPQQMADYRGLDMNGDGLGDIAWSEIPDYNGNSLMVRVRYALASGGFSAAPQTIYEQAMAVSYEYPEGGMFLGRPGERLDLDMDGAEDLLMDETYSIARISAATYGTERFDSSFYGATTLDMNGDGCPEIAYKHYTGRLRIRLNGCGIGPSGQELQGPAWTGIAQLRAHDWNADGRDDILLQGATNWQVALSNGDSFAAIVDTGLPHGGAALALAPDVNGDGLRDLLERSGSQLRLRLRNGSTPDLLLSATDGFGVTAAFSYRPLTDPAVYDPGPDAAYPDQVVRSTDQVVAELSRTDGSATGALAATHYSYAGLRRNLLGRGSLGFARRTITDATGGIPLSIEETRRQDYPFTGLPAAIVQRSASGTAVSETSYTWSALSLGSGAALRRFPYASATTIRRRESGGIHDGVEIATMSRTVAAVDATSGLVTDESTTIAESASGANPGASATLRTVHGTVLNDSANWCLGRPQATQLTSSHSLAGGSAVTRSFGQSWDGPKCRPTQIQREPGSSQWQVAINLAYDGFGNVTSRSVTGAGMSPRTTTTQWGPRGQLPVRVTNPLLHPFALSWDLGTGLPASITDPNALTVSWTYDSFGRLLQETRPGGVITAWSRDPCTGACDSRSRYRLTQRERDSAGLTQRTTTVDMDQHDRGFRFATIEPGGGKSVQILDADAHGRIRRQYRPYWEGGVPPGYWQLSYDGLGRVTTVALHSGNGAVEQQQALRHDGLSVTHVDALGRSTTATRTAWGTPAQVTDPAGGATRYEYDAFGQLLTVRDALGNVAASASYNGVGMLVAQTEMNSGTWNYTHNALGELVTLRDARAQQVHFAHDALGRLTSRAAPDGTSALTWGSSATGRNIGQLAAVAGPGYAEGLLYDALGRLSRRTISSDESFHFDYGYDTFGRVTTLSYPATGNGSRLRLAFAYDAGRLARLYDADAAATDFWRLGAVDAAGNVIDETLGSSLRVVSGFDPVTGAMDYRRSTAGAATIQDLSYAWDAADNLVQRRDHARGLVEDFRYDALDRLDDARRNGVLNLDLEYDLIGNIRRKSDVCSGAAPCYAYDATRKHAAVSIAGQPYAYDANGNMTSRAGAAIGWNSDNLPVSISGPGGNVSQFWYGPGGNRWKQVASYAGSGETTLYAGGLIEKVVRGGVTTWRHFIPAPGGMAAVHLRYAGGTAPVTRFLARDHLGSVDAILNQSGGIVVRESFTPFGRRRGVNWSGIPSSSQLTTIGANTRRGFTDHEHLDNLGLVHMNGRVYDPHIGRFLSADPGVTAPFNGQSLNRYSYVWNNPLSLVDPSGFDPEIPCAQYQGSCVRVTVIGVTWSDYLRALLGPGGGGGMAQVVSASERDPCGQDASAMACAMQAGFVSSPGAVVLTAGMPGGPTLRSSSGFDALQGVAARLGNVLISSSPVTWLFGADPGFEWFDVPDSAAGRAGATLGNVGYFLGGVAGIVRGGGTRIAEGSASAFARSLQGTTRYPGVDRFRDITLRKGTVVFRSHPGEGAFYTTASAMRRSGHSARSLFQGLQAKASDTRGYWTRIAAYEVIDDVPAAFGIAIANSRHGSGWLPQVVVPSYQTSLRYILDFPIGP
jgi:RHS repeat-associated protein